MLNPRLVFRFEGGKLWPFPGTSSYLVRNHALPEVKLGSPLKEAKSEKVCRVHSISYSLPIATASFGHMEACGFCGIASHPFHMEPDRGVMDHFLSKGPPVSFHHGMVMSIDWRVVFPIIGGLFRSVCPLVAGWF